MPRHRQVPSPTQLTVSGIRLATHLIVGLATSPKSSTRYSFRVTKPMGLENTFRRCVLHYKLIRQVFKDSVLNRDCNCLPCV